MNQLRRVRRYDLPGLYFQLIIGRRCLSSGAHLTNYVSVDNTPSTGPLETRQGKWLATLLPWRGRTFYLVRSQLPVNQYKAGGQPG
jgi:hypothetical protein